MRSNAKYILVVYHKHIKIHNFNLKKTSQLYRLVIIVSAFF